MVGTAQGRLLPTPESISNSVICRHTFAARLLEVYSRTSRLLKIRAQGMPGARCARSLMCVVESTRVSHHGPTRHSPRNGFNGYFALSPVTGLVCHRRLADTGVSGPLGLTSPPRHLMPASGHQDHTTSPSASSAVRLW